MLVLDLLAFVVPFGPVFLYFRDDSVRNAILHEPIRPVNKVVVPQMPVNHQYQHTDNQSEPHSHTCTNQPVKNKLG